MGMGESILPKDEGAEITVWSEEQDRLPLKQRLKFLLSRNTLTDLVSDSGSDKDEISTRLVKDNPFRKDDEGCHEEFQCAGVVCSHLDGISGGLSGEENHTGGLVECNDKVVGADVVSPSFVLAEKVRGFDDSCLHSDRSLGFNILGAGNSLYDDKTQKQEDENQKAASFVDELEHIVLKQRQRLLLSSQNLIFTKTFLEGKTGQLPTLAVVDSSSQQSSKIIKEIPFDDIKKSQLVEHCELSQKTSIFRSSDAVVLALPCSGDKTSHEWNHSRGSKSVNCGNLRATKNKDTACSLDINPTPSSACSGQSSLSSRGSVHNRAISNFASVKVEPLDINETSIPKASVVSPVENMNSLKIECDSPCVFEEDVLDHMLLSKRMKLRPSYLPGLDVHGTESPCKVVPSAVDSKPITKGSPIQVRIDRPRKKRKTATVSVEMALEEDAPGLLQVLFHKGVSVDEIRLYGQPDYEDGLDDLPTKENFAELEAIISKIFSKRSTLLKLSSIRSMKVEKASYCLGCLFSLVEQAHYLQFRKWPVEWGWCRDLQAFIFVFERHHRIVLERPEYGYATYFFELTMSLPIIWQVQRLITALKLNSCSRATLIENKALVVGEDLTEGEAKVLVDYGWIPNTGLGTMLNYCDRVYHDRKTEDASEWRSKIGKILADGYNGGCIVSNLAANILVESTLTDSSSIKLETN